MAHQETVATYGHWLHFAFTYICLFISGIGTIVEWVARLCFDITRNVGVESLNQA